ncbi:helix-turn-helix domain-containing protein [Vibrio sp. V31_P5A7T61]|nr:MULTISPECIES: S24 family peptidase [unclassified Vibrio]NAW60520.1 helix-turn-helix domain-containing protein [Vibrio sp. V31_P5A7T61]NAX02108.1 helix-turn-helix domain-containing protein [Vibrio sp. V34_P3A8T189]NAX08825.1 helix-turn-helix domain-containing protein [Vibrio sp. V40_P2S30T141]NAX64072.1 helix-turn-helix domain-containing protein [Vibrio sp. V32_P6A28T40]
MKMNWTDLVKARIKEVGITQEKLAELVEVTPGGMGHWLNKRREPSLEQIAKILKALKLDSLTLHSDGTLEYPDQVIANVSKVEIQPVYKACFPVLSSVQAGAWTEACEPYILADISEWHETTERTSERCFWLKVEGDSMTSATGVSFPEGTLVLVDTERDHENGSLVVAKLEDVNEATFKKLVLDAGQRFLKPLNTNYPIMSVNGNCRIIGVVVDAKLKLF